jgi:hypothetical protein
MPISVFFARKAEAQANLELLLKISRENVKLNYGIKPLTNSNTG